MSSFVVGIDGGGTSTRAWLARTDGTVLRTAEASASNVFSLGVQAAGDVLAGIISKVSGFDREKIGVVYAGIAGAGTVDSRDALSRSMARAAGIDESKCHVAHDLSIALTGALEGRPGILLLAGTGSASFGRDSTGRTWQAGGWGSLLDDAGSGYWLGMEAMKAIVQAADGRLPPSPLNAAVLEALSVAGPRELISSLRDGAHERSKIAALAPLVFDAVRLGDPVATGIAARAAVELVSLAVVVARALELGNGSSRDLISFAGGLLEGRGDFFRMVSEECTRELPSMQIHRPSQPPVGGAVALAIARIAKPLDQEGWGRLRESSNAAAG